MNEYPLCPECGGPHIYFDGTTYVCPDCSSEFDVEALSSSTAAQVCKDSNGTPLADGDAVTDSPDEVEGKVDGSVMVLRAEFLKKG